MTLEIGERHQ